MLVVTFDKGNTLLIQQSQYALEKMPITVDIENVVEPIFEKVYLSNNEHQRSNNDDSNNISDD